MKERIIQELHDFKDGEYSFYLIMNKDEYEFNRISQDDTAKSTEKDYLKNLTNFARTSEILSYFDDNASDKKYITIYDERTENEKIERLKSILNTIHGVDFIDTLDRIYEADYLMIRIEYNNQNTIRNMFVFQKLTPSSFLLNKKLLCFDRSAKLRKLKEKTITFNNIPDFFVIEDSIYIINKDRFEKFFDLDLFYRNQNEELVNDFKESGSIGNLPIDEEHLDEFFTRISSSKYFSKKFYKIGRQKYYKDINPEKLRTFIKKHDINVVYDDVFAIDERSDVNEILKILNDEYVISEITPNEYEAMEKSKIQ